jgi:cytochrome P450 family 1 subfamily D
MLLQLGRVPTLVVSSAAAAREVLLVHDHAFANRPSLAVPTRLLYGCTDIAFAPNGAYWRRARKLAVLHLLSPARVRAYRRVREEEVSELVRKVEEEQKLHGVVRLSELLSGFAKDVNGRIVLGVRASGGTGWRSKVDALMEEANALLGAFHVGDYFPWLAWLAAVWTGRMPRWAGRLRGLIGSSRRSSSPPEAPTKWGQDEQPEHRAATRRSCMCCCRFRVILSAMGRISAGTT